MQLSDVVAYLHKVFQKYYYMVRLVRCEQHENMNV